MFSAMPADLQRAIDAARGRLGAFAELRYADTVGSTNDAATQLAAAGAHEGVAVLADEQTAGRGRRGRSWSSPPGAGLYLSIVLRGRELSTAPGLVTLGAGVAAADAILAATGLPVGLKWPNDLVIGDAWRKLGGILCEAQGIESSTESGAAHTRSSGDVLIVGIGLNLRSSSHPPDVAARVADVESELGRAIDRSALIVETLDNMRALSASLRSNDRKSLLDRWRARAATGWQGAPVRWRDGHAELRGVARDVDDDGALLVECDGRRERVIAGEVVWERHP
jgi:BirA family biotin operon repressor/biotin-[acetyl-CoA-carboxylase] ligase